MPKTIELQSPAKPTRVRGIDDDVLIIIIMKIIYIAPNPLKGSRRFAKSVTATLHHKNSRWLSLSVCTLSPLVQDIYAN